VNAATWAFGPGGGTRAMEIFLSALDLLTGDEESAKAEARTYQTVQQWRENLQLRTGVTAAGASLIPGLHGCGIVLELPYLLRLMGRGAIGTGELMGAKIETEADLPAIFALWSGAINKRVLGAALGGVVIVEGVAHPMFGAKVLALGFKLGVGAAATHAGLGGAVGAGIGQGAGALGQMLESILGKVLTKISLKVSAKISTHASAKAVVGCAPLLGAGVSAAISVYILTEFLTSARIYYEHKIRDVGTR
jgi:hypothetical protein